MKVKLFCCTHDMGSKVEEIIEVPNDTTDEELDEMAKEFFTAKKSLNIGLKN